MEVALCQVDMLDRPFALEVDAELRVADREDSLLLAVAEVEVDLAVAGQPGLAEFVRREGEAARIVGARAQECAEECRLRAHQKHADQHQQGNVGALPPPVGVQLVERQEAQVVRGANQCLPLVRSGEDELQHYVVG